MNKSTKGAFTLTADEVCSSLNVSRQTLYAYVSRGKVRAQAQKGDARKSLYHAHDVEQLVASKTRGRSRRAIAKSTVSWGEPVLKSDISHIDKSKLYYHGHDAIKMSQEATFEDVAKLLTGTKLEGTFELDTDPIPSRHAFDKMTAAISYLMLNASFIDKDDRNAYMIKTVLGFICDQRQLPDEPAHILLAKHLLGDEKHADLVRRCLVLCADHELNPSAYTARVSASSNASIQACLMAALSTFSGTRHGAMTSLTRWWIGRAAMKEGADRTEFIKSTKTPPGFGHPIYPQTDPRAKELLEHIELPAGWADIKDQVGEEYKLYPNLDFALAAMEKSNGFKPKTGQTLFAFGRMIGWIAHAEEQRKSGKLIRPRAWN